MPKILISGSDTGIGKTWVTASLARALVQAGAGSVQIVKAVETGREPDEAGDAGWVAQRLGSFPSERWSVHTLIRYRMPLAPIQAARLEGQHLNFEHILEQLGRLPEADWTLLEGAGGLAVPLDKDGRDWSDLARDWGADATVLVIQDRLGAINQARLTAAYASSRGLREVGLWLNTRVPTTAAVRAVNYEALRAGDHALWARQDYRGEGIDWVDCPQWMVQGCCLKR